jgi:hypothetical protein
MAVLPGASVSTSVRFHVLLVVLLLFGMIPQLINVLGRLVTLTTLPAMGAASHAMSWPPPLLSYSGSRRKPGKKEAWEVMETLTIDPLRA